MHHQGYYVSPPLSFRDAAFVWCRTASAMAGPFWPDYFELLTARWRARHRPWGAGIFALAPEGDPSPTPEEFGRLVATTTAAVAAEWDHNPRTPAPASPAYYPDNRAICWESSVFTWLYPAPDDPGLWIVQIDGEHEERRDAAERAVAKVRQDAEPSLT